MSVKLLYQNEFFVTFFLCPISNLPKPIMMKTAMQRVVPIIPLEPQSHSQFTAMIQHFIHGMLPSIRYWIWICKSPEGIQLNRTYAIFRFHCHRGKLLRQPQSTYSITHFASSTNAIVQKKGLCRAIPLVSVHLFTVMINEIIDSSFAEKKTQEVNLT